ncbi:hypothetical protein Ddye_008365 [Dipteronia dyeriana]|uniref:Uncharacterized protein n=1 Tax=Dipteronia dyeriana TaxID=168575 RepID=A0AAD9XA92_9ROSI|nr:hypothetical protein Ddye_008365 [Dipteronia dyeriana]
MASSAGIVVKDSNSENIKVAISRGLATDMEDEEDDLFEIDLEAVDSIPPVPHYWESYFTATTNTTTLLANCLLPISDVSSAIPMVSTALNYFMSMEKMTNLFMVAESINVPTLPGSIGIPFPY